MPNWKPTENFVMSFSDETGEGRTEDEMRAMVEKLREAANPFGFDIQQWGSYTNMKNSMVSLDETENRINLRMLVNSVEGLLQFVRDKYPQDFIKDGPGFSCPHHKELDELLKELCIV